MGYSYIQLSNFILQSATQKNIYAKSNCL